MFDRCVQMIYPHKDTTDNTLFGMYIRSWSISEPDLGIVVIVVVVENLSFKKIRIRRQAPFPESCYLQIWKWHRYPGRDSNPHICIYLSPINIAEQQRLQQSGYWTSPLCERTVNHWSVESIRTLWLQSSLNLYWKRVQISTVRFHCTINTDQTARTVTNTIRWLL